MKLKHLLALLAIGGMVIAFAVSMNDWSPKKLSGFQKGEDENSRVHILTEPPKLPPGSTPLVNTPEKNATPLQGPEVKALPTIKPAVTVPIKPAVILPPTKKVDTEGLVLPPQPDDPILAWQYETTVMDYLRIGYRNKKWDQAAVDALYALGRNFSTAHDVMPNEVLAACEKAIQLGASDPLINYGNAIMSMRINGVYTQGDAEMIYLCGAFLHGSKYNPVRRGYGLIRGLYWLKRIDPELKEESIRTKYVKALGWALQDLEGALKDRKVPLEILYDNCFEIIEMYYELDKDRLKSFERVRTLLEKHRSGSALIPAVTGRFYNDYAWDARGYSFASEVAPEGWRLLAERLALAKKSLEQAYSMDNQAPHVAPNMIAVCMGSGNDRRDVDLWFDRGLKSNPDNYQLYSAKLYCLQPRWHGSAREMIELGRDCVRRAKVPAQKNKEIAFILVDAHELLSDDFRRHTGKPVEDYWKQPGVWDNIKLAYETYLEIYPNAMFSRGNFARYACLAEQWEIANEQFDIMGEHCPAAPFEGPEKMKSMQTAAAAKRKK